jgi:hypothetical protein
MMAQGVVIMDRLAFNCTHLNIKTTTNECYECTKQSACELFIDKLYEEDEMANECDSNSDDDITYDENEVVNTYNTYNKHEVPSIFNTYDKDDGNIRDDRWWMN